MLISAVTSRVAASVISLTRETIRGDTQGDYTSHVEACVSWDSLCSLAHTGFMAVFKLISVIPFLIVEILTRPGRNGW